VAKSLIVTVSGGRLTEDSMETIRGLAERIAKGETDAGRHTIIETVPDSPFSPAYVEFEILDMPDDPKAPTKTVSKFALPVSRKLKMEK
jgi:hypothetical protein